MSVSLHLHVDSLRCNLQEPTMEESLTNSLCGLGPQSWDDLSWDDSSLEDFFFREFDVVEGDIGCVDGASSTTEDTGCPTARGGRSDEVRKPYVCEKPGKLPGQSCGKTFVRVYELTRHLRHMHRSESARKLYSCERCAKHGHKGFARKDGLQRHERRLHRTKMSKAERRRSVGE